MLALWGTLFGVSVWLEVVYHFAGYGWTAFNPIFGLFLTAAWAGVWSLLIGLLSGRMKKILYYVVMWVPTVWTCVQLVYLRIFKQPLLWQIMVANGGDALTNYWREALTAVFRAIPLILLLMLPAVGIPLFCRWQGWRMPKYGSLQIMRSLVLILCCTAASVTALEIGESLELDYYEEYHEFYDPLTVAQEMGVAPLFHGDIAVCLRHFVADLREDIQSRDYVPVAAQPVEPTQFPAPQETVEPSAQPQESEEPPEETVSIYPHQYALDYDLLSSLADNDHQAWLADYIRNQTPVNSNEYTGMFEGYNLIFLTAEGFCTYAIDEELTPVLYKLSHSGFVCRNYYVPLWSTSTSDGEYINMTGLIPDGQHSLQNSSSNAEPFVLPAFFAKEGVHSYAYHDNSLSYYDRYLTHPNMGYDFKACKLGDLSEAEWGDKVFAMEGAGQWPASDYNMMVATVPEYVNDERFHVYYMTVSGHMNYNFTGNAMSAKNKDAVQGLDKSEGSKAYIACNIELDKALGSLLDQLEAAGQLERTVICLSADHYPYGFSDEEYQELAGKDLTAGKDKFRNTLILWNAGMEEPVYIDKACGPMDLLPTLLNLFGFDYDSRMYAGRDILSDQEGMVVFMNRDFVTDSVIFIEKGDITTWLQDENGDDIVPDEEKDAYLENARAEVKERYKFSAYILEENYYSDVVQAMLPDQGGT